MPKTHDVWGPAKNVCATDVGPQRTWHLKNAVGYKAGVVESLYRSHSTSSQP
jgi:hypothetical protein